MWRLEGRQQGKVIETGVHAVANPFESHFNGVSLRPQTIQILWARNLLIPGNWSISDQASSIVNESCRTLTILTKDMRYMNCNEKDPKYRVFFPTANVPILTTVFIRFGIVHNYVSEVCQRNNYFPARIYKQRIKIWQYTGLNKLQRKRTDYVAELSIGKI